MNRVITCRETWQLNLVMLLHKLRVMRGRYGIVDARNLYMEINYDCFGGSDF